MRSIKLIVAALACVQAAACVSRYPLANVSAASMTHSNSSTQKTYTDLGPVETKYCTGDAATSTTGSEIGLMDEVTLRAQKEKGANYIFDANYFMEGGCIVLKGVAKK